MGSAQFVVVVEHDPSRPGYSEVPKEHVSRKDVRHRQVLDRPPVIDHPVLSTRLVIELKKDFAISASGRRATASSYTVRAVAQTP